MSKKIKPETKTVTPKPIDFWTNYHNGDNLKLVHEESLKIEGIKYDGNKPPMDLLSHTALSEIAKVFGHGAKKYGKHNYKKGMEWSRVIAAAYRHLGSFNSGQDIDDESGLLHLAHLGACVQMLIDFYHTHKDKDDRYKR